MISRLRLTKAGVRPVDTGVGSSHVIGVCLESVSDDVSFSVDGLDVGFNVSC